VAAAIGTHSRNKSFLVLFFKKELLPCLPTEPERTFMNRNRPPRIIATLLCLIGIVLTLPGTYLILLGGSPYYTIAGILCIVSAALIWRGDSRGLQIYAALLAGTVLWSLWEIGFDGWALMPRVVGPLLFGVWLALPTTRRRLGARSWFGVLVIACLVGLPLGVFLGAPTAPPPGPIVSPSGPPANLADGDWTAYGRDQAGTRFSPLAQITPQNVAQLAPAWQFHTGVPTNMRVSLEVTPLKIRDRLYVCTGYNDLIALDAETGKQAWRYHANPDPSGLYAGTCRGVAYYKIPSPSSPDVACAERLLMGTVDRRLIAVDLQDGKPGAGFGKDGVVDLGVGMGPIEPGYYFVTSAPQIVRGRVVVGGWVTDGQHVGEPSGVIRAFDAVTGELSWAWDMGRPDQHGLPPPGASFTPGTPNSWAPISADEDLGLVYLPMGTSAPGYYGGYRTPVEDHYSSAVVALDAETGALRWSFQTTHHDLWDYDVSSQPTLVDLPGGVKALLQPTKRGEIFLLDRRTGTPLAGVEERAVPQGSVPGEKLAATQPFSVGMPSFAGPMPTEARMWGVTPFDQLWCRIKFREARFDGTMTPVGTDRPTLTYPGYLGGMDWGGVAVDLSRNLMIVNSNRVGNYNRLIPRSEADRLGIKPFSAHSHDFAGGPVAQAGTPYAVSVASFLSPLLVPCTQPPYGMISAVDLTTKRLVWSKPFGTARDSGPLTIPSHLPFTMGMPNIGGAVATKGGVFFIGSAQDNFLRAYETATGRELWRTRLPAGGQATPMTYWSAASGRQFVLIAAGGHGGLLTTPGDTLAAYALPKQGAAP
jgi:quinoprotein glucose dehydrogenase